MIPLGYKIPYTKITAKKYDCSECEYVKYGKAQKIKDFVNAGRAGTEAKKIIGKQIDLQDLKKMCAEIPEQKEIIDMNLDPYMASRIKKHAEIEYKKIEALKKQQETLKLEEELKRQEELNKKQKEDNVNE